MVEKISKMSGKYWRNHIVPGLLATVVSFSTGAGIAHAEIRHTDDNERRLLEALTELRNTDIDSALANVEKLVEENPDFKLAQMIYADLLLAKVSPLDHFGGLVGSRTEFVEPLLDEARMRWQHHATHPDSSDELPRFLLQLDPSQKHVLVVDASHSRLYLFKNEDGTPVLQDDFYASIGKNGFGKIEEGDKKTPVGVYFVSRYLDPQTLPDFYGNGAFPINYPNSWDRHLGRTGYGIWLHGNPLGTFSRPPQDSDGCVTVTNRDLDYLKNFIDIQNTPFIIADQIEWQPANEIAVQQQYFKNLLNQWREDWESRDVERYLSHYSTSFDAEGKNYENWTAYKRNVNGTKSFIDVELDNVSIFQYPDDTKVLVVTFDQEYRSDSYRSQTRKRLYWKQEDDGRWRIFYEGSV